jgi:electron transfer flavoprotein beta subunit
MKIICTVKFVPDVENMVPGDVDADNATRMILNPDDACALAFALKMKQDLPECSIDVISMGPASVRPHMEDLIRLNVDRGVLICDPVFDGSDAFIISEVLARYLDTQSFDCLMTGSTSLERGSSQVPVQLAQSLGMEQMSGIVWIDPSQFNNTKAVFKRSEEMGLVTYEMRMPGILSVTRESRYTLPYLKLNDIKRDVSDDLTIITNQDLGFSENEVGTMGSPTKIMKTTPRRFQTKEGIIVHNDDEGILLVFNYLKQKRFL